jgi:hypothetical protein
LRENIAYQVRSLLCDKIYNSYTAVCDLEYEIKDKSRIKNKNAGEEDWEADPWLEKVQGEQLQPIPVTLWII